MNTMFKDYLNENNYSDDAVEVAARSFLSELCDDIPPDDMKINLGKISNQNELEEILSSLEDSPYHRCILCKLFLETAWENEQNRPKIQAAFKETAGKLPVIEASLLAVVAMYGMYLIANHFKNPNVVVEEVDKDNSHYKKTELTFGTPESPIDAIKKILSLS